MANRGENLSGVATPAYCMKNMLFNTLSFRNQRFITESFGTIRPPAMALLRGFSLAVFFLTASWKRMRGLPAQQYRAPGKAAAQPGHHHQITALQLASLLQFVQGQRH